jgi:cellulose 1,4-beta-cellobiosidase
MRADTLLTAFAVTSTVSAVPYGNPIWKRHNTSVSHGPSMRRAVSYSAPVWKRQNDTTPNPFEGRKLFANPVWGAKLAQTHEAFLSEGDTENANKVTAIQDIGTFVWVSNIAGLSNIDAAIDVARATKEASGVDQIIGLVVYNLPDRDCSAGESAGELKGAEGLSRYKSDYIVPFAEKVGKATDLTFAVVLEPDSLANLVTNMAVEQCANAAPLYKEGIAYAISSLQFPNVHLYIDAAHGGWLGWDDNLAPSEFESTLSYFLANIVLLLTAHLPRCRDFRRSCSYGR